MNGETPRELSLLLLECFGKSNYSESFPQVFGEKATARQFKIMQEKSLAAFCASIPFHWNVNGARVTGHCIGSVCSAEKFRGQGFASKAIILAELEAAREGADFTFLFSDLDIFYRKIGYEPYGQEQFAALGASPAINDAARKNLSSLSELAASVGAGVRYGFTKPNENISHEHTAALWNLISVSSHSSENFLAFDEFLKLLSIPDVEIHTLWDHQNPLAVFFVGKGADFQNVAHSAAAKNPAFLAKLFTCYFKKFPGRSLLFMLPPGAHAFARTLDTAPAPAYYAKILCTDPSKRTFIKQILAEGALYPRTFQSI